MVSMFIRRMGARAQVDGSNVKQTKCGSGVLALMTSHGITQWDKV